MFHELKLKLDSLTLSHKGYILVSVPLVYGTIFIVILYFLMVHAEQEVEEAHRAEQTMYRSTNLVKRSHDAGMALLDYLVRRDEPSVHMFEQARDDCINDVDTLKVLVANEPEQKENIRRIHQLMMLGTNALNSIRQDIDQNDIMEANRKRRKMSSIFKGLAFAIVELESTEKRLSKATPATVEHARRLVKEFLAMGILSNVIVAVGLAMFFTRGTIRRLAILMDNTVRLAIQKTLNPRLGGRDEIGQIDDVFHEMPDLLEEAAQKERAILEEVRRSEKRVKHVIESMPVGILVIDESGTIELSNQSIETTLGHNLEELKGKNLRICFENDDSDDETFMDKMRKSSLGKVTELMLTTKTDRKVPVEFSMTEFDTVEGRRLLAIVFDISERYEVRKMRQAFVATVTHEIRTPLTSIRGYLECLEGGVFGVELTDNARQGCTFAERNTERLITLINDLLDIEKLESGQLDMTLGNIQLNNVLERSNESVMVFAEKHGVKLEIPTINVEVYGDENRLIQVLVNLLSNAVKFSPKGGLVRVNVESKPDWAEVQVIDHGRGIPARFKEAVFERFQQVEKEDATKKSGTGLGLAICKAIVEQHKGSIGVESEEGKGSTFWFRVPASR